MSLVHLTAAFFLAVAVILAVCAILTRLLAPLRQPPVVAEMIAGIVLGPSLLGWLVPEAQAALFPEQLRPVIYVAGQLGLVVFMFQAGHELNLRVARRVARSAAAISAAGVVVPLALGIGLVLLVSGSSTILPPAVPAWVIAPYVGVTLAITAFPMMVRIIEDRGLRDTRIGTVSLAAGAIDDAVAWILLAGVFSLAAGSAGPIVRTVGGTLLLVAVLLLVARRRDALGALAERVGPEQRTVLVLGVLAVVAWYTDVIGLFAVFGAFALGVVCPRTAGVTATVRGLRGLTVVLLPLFFTASGLNTDFGLLTDPGVLLFAAACIALAIVGKFGACWLAARAVGEPPRDALRIGTLMNARGLMQLIAINLGLTAGLVTPALFSVLVLVALVTTVMAGPVLSLLGREQDEVEPVEPVEPPAVRES